MLTEPDGDTGVVAVDLARCQGCDLGRGLAEQQDQTPGDTVGGLDAVVVQKPGGPGPGAGGRRSRFQRAAPGLGMSKTWQCQ